MITEIKVRAFHASDLNKTTSGIATITDYDHRSRSKRAVKTLGIIWGLALASVLIPIIHFFLPWIGIITGPFLAIWVYGIESEIITGHFPCPRCQAPVTIAKQRNRWPLREICVPCSSEIKVEKNE